MAKKIAIGASFSPVAGIKVVESDQKTSRTPSPSCFSPVAGIKVVESYGIPDYDPSWALFQSRCRD